MNKYTSYILYMLISIVVALLYVNDFKPLNNLQRSVNDFLCSFTANDNTRPNVAFVTIDSHAQDTYGSWPWNYDLIADLLAAAATGEPKAIIVDFVLSEDARQDSSGHTRVLAEQLRWIDRAVLPYDIALTTFQSSNVRNPEHLFDFSVGVDNPLGFLDEDASLQVRKVFLPAGKLLESDPYLGFDYTMPDDDKVLRHQALVMNYDGYYYPSLALLGAAVYLEVKPEDIKVIENQEIQVGSKRRIPINDMSQMFINFSGRNSIQRFSAAQILGEEFELNRLKDKLVVIDFEDAATSQIFKTPIQKQTPKSVITASVAENIINNNFVSHTSSSTLLNLVIIFAVGGMCAFVLPQVSLLYRIVILGIALIVLANVDYFLLSSFKMIVNMVYFGTELVFFMLASPLLDTEFIKGPEVDRKKTARSGIPEVTFEPETAQADRPLAVREIVASGNDPENQETVALTKNSPDHLHDHQAINIDGDLDETIIASDSGGLSDDEGESGEDEKASDSGESGPAIISAGDLQETPPAESSELPRAGESGSIVSGFGGKEITHLGRYQITGTLGRGAMGHVYKGIDPAINRPVALKTIRLDFVNDPDEMAELKERLFREAQAAGKLSHPNIVTIYDVGSEGHLQYIAMEFLEGQTLDEMIKRKTIFNYRIIAKIIMQICSALEYAHREGIIHRDIKPANIMVMKDYRVKVMDYGIARIDSNSMTKTGIAMGTPNYISPEQLRGLPVDQRADIFSLGVVIYEMLVGRRPFKGENITSLIYSTLNHDPEKPSRVNPQIPLLFDRIVDRALRKVPAERYQRASEMAAALNDFVASFVN